MQAQGCWGDPGAVGGLRRGCSGQQHRLGGQLLGVLWSGTGGSAGQHHLRAQAFLGCWAMSCLVKYFCLPMRPPTHAPTCLSTHVPICLSIHPSIYLPTHLPIYLPTCPSLPPPRAPCRRRGSLGSLQLQVRLRDETVLPSHCYRPLVQLLCHEVKSGLQVRLHAKHPVSPSSSLPLPMASRCLSPPGWPSASGHPPG